MSIQMQLSAQYGSASINQSGWSYTAGDFEERGGAIYLARPTGFGADATLSLPADGLVAINSGNLASAVVSDGELTLTSNAGTYTWDGGAQTSPGVARVRSEDYANGFLLPSESRIFWFARMELVTYPNTNDGIHLLTYRAASPSDHIFGGIRIGASNLYLASDGSVASANNEGLGVATPTSCWMCNEVGPNRAINWRIYSDVADIPESGWTQAIVESSIFSAGETVQTGFVLKSGGAAVAGKVTHFSAWKAPLWETEPDTLPFDQMEPMWMPTGSLFDTSGKVASFVIDVPSNVSISDAYIRTVLQQSVVFGASKITVRASRGSAPSGSYQALSAVTIDGSGQDLYIDVKMISDGTTPVGMRTPSLSLW